MVVYEKTKAYADHSAKQLNSVRIPSTKQQTGEGGG